MLEVELLPRGQHPPCIEPVVMIRLITHESDGRVEGRRGYYEQIINLPLSLMPTLIGKGQEILLSEVSKGIASLEEKHRLTALDT